MASVKDSFVDVERYRLQLEESIGNLKRSLHHWQTWEAEYEGLMEEIHDLGENHTDQELVRIDL